MGEGMGAGGWGGAESVTVILAEKVPAAVFSLFFFLSPYRVFVLVVALVHVHDRVNSVARGRAQQS